jgi:pyruvate dehydrogenase E2 component (dihydrolipoamide acetyltransferase)
MHVDVIFPKVSLDQDGGSVARWCVSDGQAVAEGDVLFEIDNDKAAVEVVAPAGGVIRGLVATGEQVASGTSVARIDIDGQAPAAPAIEPVGDEPAPTTTASVQVLSPGNRRSPNPTPLARRLAREHDICLDGLIGTGPRGRVQKTDIVAAMKSGQATVLPPATRLSTSREGTSRLHSAWLRDGDGIPVVMLHGFGGDLNGWRGLWAGGRSNWPALGIDLPAHGQSPREIPDDLDALAQRVEAALTSLRIGPVVLAGHSLGGAVAARLARRAFVEVRGLCLFAPAGLGPEFNAPFLDGIVRAQTAESLRPWLELLVEDPAMISDTFVRLVEAQRADAGLTQAMASFARRFFPDGTQRFSIMPDLAATGCATRVVFGRQDRILPFAQTGRLPDNVALHGLADCGHMPHIEKPALALGILDEVRRIAAT